jgi:hypothetical protein
MWQSFRTRLQGWVSIIQQKPVRMRIWLFAQPTNPSGKHFGLGDLEVSLLLILFLAQVALPMMGVQQNFWWASSCWIGIAALSIRVIWKWESTARRSNFVKILTSVCLLMVIVLLVREPLMNSFYLTVKPSFIFLMPGQELVECERRAFIVKHVGARVLSNPEIVLWDNKGQNGVVTKYSEISPGEPDPAAPQYIWWNPMHPWDEDYTVTITSGNEKTIQHLIARSAQGQLRRATEVFVNGKRVFACRDSSLPSTYTLAASASVPCAPMNISQEITQRVEGASLGVQNPNGSVTITKLRSITPAPGIEGHREARHIWEYQKVRLIRDLSKYPNTRVTLFAASTGTDTWNYAQELAKVLRLANWSVEGPRKLSAVYDGMLDIQVSADNISPPRPEVRAVLDALTGSGIKHRKRDTLDPDVARGMIVLWVGSRSPEGISPDDCSGVGLRPPTEQDPPCTMVAAFEHVCPFPPQ